MKMKEKLYIFYTLLYICMPLAHAQFLPHERAGEMQTIEPAMQEDTLEISLLTCGPGPEVYALYGHTALRVRNLRNGDDFVFNYGSFNMNTPYFIPKFTLGLMDYELGGAYYQDFARRYAHQGIDVTHQVLNLSSDEKKRMLDKLMVNYEPANRVYRYNFIYDNCSTRPRDIIEASTDDKIVYREDSLSTTYRQMLHQFNDKWPWSKLGVDLCLGAEADKVLTLRQQEFLPSYLMDHLQKAIIRNASGEERPLVAETFIEKADVQMDESPEFIFTPMQCALILLVVVLLITICEIIFRRLFWGVDLLLFAAQGITGFILCVLFFFSDHPTVGSNWLIWLFNPLPLFYLPILLYKGIKRKKDVYHVLNILVLTLFMLFFVLIPQDIPFVVVPLALVLLARSVSHILLCKK